MSNRVISRIKDLFLNIDLFQSSQMLRYKGSEAIQTYTGAIVSFILIILFCIIFSSNVFSTFQKSNIVSKTIKDVQNNPSPYILSITQTSQFAFVVGLQGIDLSYAQKYFDISLEVYQFSKGVKVNSTKIQLQSCKRSFLNKFQKQISDYYDSLSLNKWMCPPQNLSMQIQGKYTSKSFKYGLISIRKCSSNCIGDQAITDYLAVNNSFKLNVYFVNPIINPGQSKYLSYFFDDRMFFQFTKTSGVQSSIFFSKFQVKTDNSILPQPYSDQTNIVGVQILNLPSINNYQISNNDTQYARIYFKKDIYSNRYIRSYTRIDTTLSYIGGLLGLSLLLFYGLRMFSEYSYEFDIGSNLFLDNDGNRFQTKYFNIFTFPLYIFYCIITFISPSCQNSSIFSYLKKIDYCRQQTKEQLDITFILRRMNFIQRFIQKKFYRQLSNLKLQDQMTIQEAQQKRKFYDDHEKVHQIILQSQNKKRTITIKKPTIYEQNIIPQNVNDGISFQIIPQYPSSQSPELQGSNPRQGHPKRSKVQSKSSNSGLSYKDFITNKRQINERKAQLQPVISSFNCLGN